MPCIVSGIVAAFAILLAPPSPTSPAVLPAPTGGLSSHPVSTTPVELSFQELIDAGASGVLKPSLKALELEGRRVRITGFMAELEDSPRGGFYLCALPVHGDESGGGLGDVPVNAVAVHVPYAKDKVIPPRRGRVIVTGVFHVGTFVPTDDFIGAFHLTADPPVKFVAKPARPAGRRKPLASPRRAQTPRGN